MSLYLMIAVALALSGALMLTLSLAYHTGYGRSHRIREGDYGSASAKDFRSNAISNAVLSISLVFTLTYLLYPFLYDEGAVPTLRILVEGAAILLLYDFFYYLVHRYPFHAWKLLRAVHAKHHVVRNPSAIDSLYLHPLECFLGLTLLWLCAGLVRVVAGPVSIYSFAWAFLVYASLNVVVHSGLRIGGFPFSIITYLGRRHDKHHRDMKAMNFASVTPLWDHVLGTEEP